MTTRPAVANAREVAIRCAERLRQLWARPDDVKITILVRVPWLEDGDFLVTEDDAEAVQVALARLFAKGGA